MNYHQISEFQRSFSNFYLFLESNNQLFQKYHLLHHFEKNMSLLKKLTFELSYCPIDYLKKDEKNLYSVTETSDYWLLGVDREEEDNNSYSSPLINYRVLFYKDASRICFSHVSIDYHLSQFPSPIMSYPDISHQYHKILEFYIKNDAEYRYFSLSEQKEEKLSISFPDFLVSYQDLLEEESAKTLLHKLKFYHHKS